MTSDPAPAGPPHELVIEPVRGPLDAVVRPPGSKSLTNRALVCAALGFLNEMASFESAGVSGKA